MYSLFNLKGLLTYTCNLTCICFCPPLDIYSFHSLVPCTWFWQQNRIAMLWLHDNSWNCKHNWTPSIAVGLKIWWICCNPWFKIEYFVTPENYQWKCWSNWEINSFCLKKKNDLCDPRTCVFFIKVTILTCTFVKV